MDEQIWSHEKGEAKARRELDELVCVKPFGEGFRRKLQEMWGIQNAFALPLVPEVAESGR